MSVKISILVEGATEKVFFPILREFLKPRLEEMPKLDPVPCNGRIPKFDQLKRQVELLLSGPKPADAVIALTDVYTGTNDFTGALDAKEKMKLWTGHNPKFYPHVALHDFEAWLLPYWTEIQKLAGSNRSQPNRNPEAVNHARPPSYVLSEVFFSGSKNRNYVKPRDAKKILEGRDLTISANACPELKLFLNTVLRLSGGNEL